MSRSAGQIQSRATGAGTAAAQNHSAGIQIQRSVQVESSWPEQHRATKTVGIRRERSNRINSCLDVRSIVAADRIDGTRDRDRGQRYASALIAGKRKIHDAVAVAVSAIVEASVRADRNPG